MPSPRETEARWAPRSIRTKGNWCSTTRWNWMCAAGRKGLCFMRAMRSLSATTCCAACRARRDSFRGGEAQPGEANLLFRSGWIGGAAGRERMDFRSPRRLRPAWRRPARRLNLTSTISRATDGWRAARRWIRRATAGRCTAPRPPPILRLHPQGLLRHAHLERGVIIHSDESSSGAGWRDGEGEPRLAFAGGGRGFSRSRQGAGGTGVGDRYGGVVITGQTQRGNGPVIPSRMAADQVTATFGDRQVLTHRGWNRARQPGADDRLPAPGRRRAATASRRHLAPPRVGDTPLAKTQNSSRRRRRAESRFNPRRWRATWCWCSSRAATGRGTANRRRRCAPLRGGRSMKARASGCTSWSIRAWKAAALQLTADKLDVSQGSGDAFAHGNVKATWTGQGGQSVEDQGRRAGGWLLAARDRRTWSRRRPSFTRPPARRRSGARRGCGSRPIPSALR